MGVVFWGGREVEVEEVVVGGVVEGGEGAGKAANVAFGSRDEVSEFDGGVDMLEVGGGGGGGGGDGFGGEE